MALPALPNFMREKETVERYDGALLDNRSQVDKIKDYKLEEIVANVNPVKWVEKSSFKSYPIFNQDGSGSCVAQTVAKMLGIMYQELNNEYVHFSATHVYQRRSNKPYSGMIGVNALDIARQGTTLEVLVPSQNMTDAQMDAVQIQDYKKEVGTVFKVGNYVQLPVRNIDAIASVIQTTGKPVMVWFYFDINEWTEQPLIRNHSLTVSAGSRHSVTAVDFALVDGKKCLIIDDSWGTRFGKNGQRIITEDFFKVRNFFAAYFIDFKFGEADKVLPGKPKHTFRSTLHFSPTFKVLADVVALQDILKYEGVFPRNVDSTGYYGSVTARAVHDFQVKHSVGTPAELAQLQGRSVGPKTIEKLNQLYS